MSAFRSKGQMTAVVKWTRVWWNDQSWILSIAFYVVDAGGIYFDGKDIRDYDLIVSEARWGIVLQDPVLLV